MRNDQLKDFSEQVIASIKNPELDIPHFNRPNFLQETVLQDIQGHKLGIFWDTTTIGTECPSVGICSQNWDRWVFCYSENDSDPVSVEYKSADPRKEVEIYTDPFVIRYLIKNIESVLQQLTQSK